LFSFVADLGSEANL